MKGGAPSAPRPVEPVKTTLDLVGVTEVAQRAGVASINVVYMWRKRHADFPPPYVELAMGPVWLWEFVAAWLAKPRPSGRPRRVVQDVEATAKARAD